MTQGLSANRGESTNFQVGGAGVRGFAFAREQQQDAPRQARPHLQWCGPGDSTPSVRLDPDTEAATASVRQPTKAPITETIAKRITIGRSQRWENAKLKRSALEEKLQTAEFTPIVEARAGLCQ